MSNYLNTGTAVATNGSKTVTFTGVSLALVQAGDQFMQGGASELIASVDVDAGTVELVNNWGGGSTPGGAAYTVLAVPADSELAVTTRKLMEGLTGPIQDIIAMSGDNAPDDGDLLVWDGDSATWVTTGSTGDGDLVRAAAPTITGHPTIEGVTSTGATGAGKLVFGSSPTIDAPTITGHATLEGATLTGKTGTGKVVLDNSPAFSGHITIEGQTLTGVTGTGKAVLDSAPTISGPLTLAGAAGVEAYFDFAQSTDGRDVVGELVVHGTQPFLNGLVVTTDDPDGYPATAYRTYGGKEHSAIGVAGWPNAGFLTGFWEVSDLEGVNPPPRRMMVATGMDPDGGGYGNWPRFWDEPETYRMGLGYFDFSDAMLDTSQGTLQYFMPQGHDTSFSISQKYIASLFLGYAADNHVAVIGGDSNTTALSFAKNMNGTFTAVSEVAKIDLTNDAFLLGVGAQIGSEKLAVVTSGAHNGATLQVSSGSQYPLLLWNTNNSGDSNYMLAGRNTSFTAVGNINYTASSGLFALNSTSDQNLKQRIGPYRPGDALRRLKVHEYLRLDEPLSEITIGMFAQEAYEQFPHSVRPGIGVPGDPDFTPWSLNMSFFVPPIIATVQDILDRLDAANI